MEGKLLSSREISEAHDISIDKIKNRAKARGIKGVIIRNKKYYTELEVEMLFKKVLHMPILVDPFIPILLREYIWKIFCLDNSFSVVRLSNIFDLPVTAVDDVINEYLTDPFIIAPSKLNC